MARTSRSWLRIGLAGVFLLVCGAVSHAGRFSVGDEPSAPTEPAPAPAGADWERAVAFPGWVAVVSEGAEREYLARGANLRTGADGSVSLRLKDATRIALRNNLDITVESYTPRLAAQNVEARRAIYDPLFRFTLAYLKSSSPTVGVLEGALVLTQDRYDWNFDYSALYGPGTRYSLAFGNNRTSNNSVFTTVNPSYNSRVTLGVSQPLLRNFGFEVTDADVRIALTQEQQADETFRNRVINTVVEVEDAYWGLAQRLKELEVQQEALRLAEELLQINKTRVEVGTMAPLEIAQAEAQVAQAEEAVLVAESAVEDSEDVLRRLLNIPLDSPLWDAPIRPVDPPTLKDVDVEVGEAIEKAFQNRNEVRQAELTLDADQIRLDVAKNGVKPVLDLQASLDLAGVGGTTLIRDDDNNIVNEVEGGYRDALEDVFAAKFRSWRVGASFELPIFNQAAKASHESALLNLRKDQDQLERTRLAVAEDVRRAVRQLATSRKRVDAARATASYREKSLDAERKKFDHGLSTNFEVLRVQSDLTEARTGVVRAFADYLRALTNLHRSMGVVLDERDIRLTQLADVE